MLATDKSLKQLLVNDKSNKRTGSIDIFNIVSLSSNKSLSDDLAGECCGGCSGCGSGPSPEGENIFKIISFTLANLQTDNQLSGLECGGCDQCSGACGN